MNRGLEPAELWSVAGPTHGMGPDDDVVTLERNLALYRGLPDASWPSSLPTRRAAPVVLDLECGSAAGDGQQDGGVF